MEKVERYLNDAKFHNLVESFEKLVADEVFSLQDFSDALDIAAQQSVQQTKTYGVRFWTCPDCKEVHDDNVFECVCGFRH